MNRYHIVCWLFARDILLKLCLLLLELQEWCVCNVFLVYDPSGITQQPDKVMGSYTQGSVVDDEEIHVGEFDMG